MVASGAQAPWTVLCQGTSISIDQANVLDKFEYTARTNGDVKLLLSGDSFESIAVALLAAIEELNSSTGLQRAALALQKLLSVDRTYPEKVVRLLGDKNLAPFVKQLHGEANEEAVIPIADTLGTLLCAPSAQKSAAASGQSGAFTEFIISKLTQESTPPEQLVGLCIALSNYLRFEPNRMTFISEGKGLPALADLLEEEHFPHIHVMYQATFALWLLSFTSSEENTAIMEEAMAVNEIPRRLTAVLREVSAEKVVRVTLAFLRNLAAEKVGSRLRREMIGAGLVGALEQLCLRRWNDTDIRDDLFSLADFLNRELKYMSTFDVYRSEVLSGALSWTPVHKDENFWRESTEKMDQGNHELLRCLVRALHESTDPVVLAVACHDLGMFIKHHPRGRMITQSLGVKARLMELMSDSDPDVRRQALTCVQILMISHYDIMQRSATK